MIHVDTLTFNPLQENTYVVYDDAGACMIVDPGCYELSEQQELTDFITRKNLKVKLLVNTHGHVDHVLGNYFVKETYKVPLEIFHADLPTLTSVSVYAASYGFFQYSPAIPDRLLQETDVIKVGTMEFEILFVPGHAPGHIAFVNRAEKICLSGDVLFRNSIGRPDLPGGDLDTLIESIHTKLFTLPDDTTIYPGHGAVTTILYEKQHNPYCAIK
ncbi:MAG: MBL fold metallo-hydrolase [Cytophagales bacterium]|nr:MBL fold metallo-hydrolase [Cytophaga sp.]